MNTEQMEEIKRHFGVAAKALRSNFRQVADGHVTIRHECKNIVGRFVMSSKKCGHFCGSHFPSLHYS